MSIENRHSALRAILSLGAGETGESEAAPEFPSLNERVAIELQRTHGPAVFYSREQRLTARAKLIDEMAGQIAQQDRQDSTEQAPTFEQPASVVSQHSARGVGFVAVFARLFGQALLLPRARAAFAIVLLCIMLFPIALHFYRLAEAPTVASAEIATGTVTHVLLANLEKKANDMIDHASDVDNFLIGNTAEQARSIIEAWKKANSETLDEVFYKQDKTSQQLFLSIANDLNRISTEPELEIQDAKRFTVEWAQMLKILPMSNKDAELWYYTPSVIMPVGRDDIIPRLIGPKLAQSKPEIRTPDNESLAINIATEGEVDATIKRQSLQFDETTSKFVTYKFNFVQSEGLFMNRTVNRELTVWLPPVIMAHYRIIPRVEQVTYERLEYPTDVGGKGKDSPYPITVGVRPDLAAAGWKIDVERIVRACPNWYTDLGGDHADCAGLFDNRVSEESFVFNVQLGHRTDIWGHKSDAWKNCRVFVPVRRAITAVVDSTPLEGDLNWSDDKEREIPADIVPLMVGKTIEVTLFNGRTYVIDAQNRSPLGLLTVEDSGSSVSFKPNRPSQF